MESDIDVATNKFMGSLGYLLALSRQRSFPWSNLCLTSAMTLFCIKVFLSFSPAFRKDLSASIASEVNKHITDNISPEEHFLSGVREKIVAAACLAKKVNNHEDSRQYSTMVVTRRYTHSDVEGAGTFLAKVYWETAQGKQLENSAYLSCLLDSMRPCLKDEQTFLFGRRFVSQLVESMNADSETLRITKLVGYIILSANLSKWFWPVFVSSAVTELSTESSISGEQLSFYLLLAPWGCNKNIHLTKPQRADQVKLLELLELRLRSRLESFREESEDWLLEISEYLLSMTDHFLPESPVSFFDVLESFCQDIGHKRDNTS